MHSTCAVLSSVTCLAPQQFYTLSHKRHEIKKKKLLSIKSVFWFFIQLWCVTFFNLRRTEQDVTVRTCAVHRSSRAVPLLLSDFIETSIFSTDFRKIPNQISWKIRPVGAELFHAYGRTDMTELIAFRDFANGPKNSPFCPHSVLCGSQNKQRLSPYTTLTDWFL
jgi:hypothetical protein